MRSRRWVVRAAVVLLALSPATVFAQSTNRGVELGGHVAVLRLSEFDVTDTGIGVTAAWWATPIFALDSSLSWFPGSGDGTTSTRLERQQRVLGLVGTRSGIRRGSLELFGRARAGFVRFSPLEGAVCVAITTVPLPLECHVASGDTNFASDIGGGVSVTTSRALQIRIDAGDLMVRYARQAYRSNGELSDGFTSHNVQVSSAIVWRF
jgi:hypothetical protein